MFNKIMGNPLAKHEGWGAPCGWEAGWDPGWPRAASGPSPHGFFVVRVTY